MIKIHKGKIYTLSIQKDTQDYFNKALNCTVLCPKNRNVMYGRLLW